MTENSSQNANPQSYKILVTGHDGFIGSHLLKNLTKITNIQIVPFQGDLLSKEDVEKCFTLNPDINLIIHLVGAFFGEFKQLIDLNVIALENLLGIATKKQVKKIIFTSTGAVYGEPVAAKSKETDVLSPNTLYGLSKKYSEECIHYYHQNFDLQFVILRLSTVYGPDNNKGVIYNFLTDIKEKKQITIYGDGTQSRNFLHVSDACNAIEKSIYYPKSETFNISNDQQQSINDLVDLFKQKFEFTVQYKPSNNNLKNLFLDTQKASDLLEFKAQKKELTI